MNLKTCRREREDMMSPSENQPYRETITLSSLASQTFAYSQVTGVMLWSTALCGFMAAKLDQRAYQIDCAWFHSDFCTNWSIFYAQYFIVKQTAQYVFRLRPWPDLFRNCQHSWDLSMDETLWSYPLWTATANQGGRNISHNHSDQDHRHSFTWILPLQFRWQRFRP